MLRQLAFASQYLMNRCLMGEDEPDEILAGAEETLRRLGESRVGNGLVSARQIVEEYAGGINASSIRASESKASLRAFPGSTRRPADYTPKT